MFNCLSFPDFILWFAAGVFVGLWIGVLAGAVFFRARLKTQKGAMDRARIQVDKLRADMDRAEQRLAERKGRVSC